MTRSVRQQTNAVAMAAFSGFLLGMAFFILVEEIFS